MKKRDEILRFVRDCPYSPSVREIASEVGLASPSTVQKHLNRLVTDGLLARGPGGRVYVTAKGMAA